MEMVIKILQVYILLTIALLVIYTIRHFKYTYNRLFYKQRVSYRDIYDSDLPKISVIIPRYNTENVGSNVITSLLECDYDRDKLEIIPVNECYDERINEILNDYHEKYPFIKPVQQLEEDGEIVDLNDALKIATGEIIVVFEEKYRPSKNLLKKIVAGFKDPKIGAVISRVIPSNENKSILTVLLNLERSGGYQIEQQTRYNMKFLPQYSGGVIGFRRNIALAVEGFDTRVLSQETELVYRMYSKGWNVVYDNSAECYEEAPKTWKSRGEQIRRWSRGHNQLAFKYFFKFLFSGKMSFKAKVDGILMLNTGVVSFGIALAHIICVILFFLGDVSVFGAWIAILLLGMCNSLENFIPFFEMGTAAFIDGTEEDVLALPYCCISFYLYTWYISLGYMDAILDKLIYRNRKNVKVTNFDTELVDLEGLHFIVTLDEKKGKDTDTNELFFEEVDDE